MRDRSLDEFVDGGDRDGGGDQSDGAVRDPDPVVSTYAVSSDGAACASCGAVVERRWRDDEGLVCGDCKGW